MNSTSASAWSLTKEGVGESLGRQEGFTRGSGEIGWNEKFKRAYRQ
jgi:hypothetical protein